MKAMKKIIAIILLSLIGYISVQIGFFYIGQVRSLPSSYQIRKKMADYTNKQKILIYSSSNKIIYDSHKNILNPNDFTKIPKYIKQAFISVEDLEFNNHLGFNFFAILRAFLTNFYHQNIVEGGEYSYATTC